jgi:hypothetical protein
MDLTPYPRLDLWSEYKNLIFETFPDLYHHSTWAEWEGKGTSLLAKVYGTAKDRYIHKSREVEIWDEKSCIYNNIIYPRTGENVPCFGMDLMGFFDKKVIIVFDFQHPVENYLFSHPDLPKADGTFRFFEPGNHFSENIFVRKCTMDEVNDYLDDFRAYLHAYRDMLESAKPSKNFMYATYRDFDAYMRKLDPVSGYLNSKFGQEQSEKLVNDFLFCYA